MLADSNRPTIHITPRLIFSQVISFFALRNAEETKWKLDELHFYNISVDVDIGDTLILGTTGTSWMR